MAEGQDRAGRGGEQRGLVQDPGPFVVFVADHRDLGQAGQPGLGHGQARAGRARVAGRDHGEHAEGRLGGLAVAGRAGQRGVAEQRAGHGEGAGGGGVVGRVGGAEDQRLAVRGGVVEPALAVAEGVKRGVEHRQASGSHRASPVIPDSTANASATQA